MTTTTSLFPTTEAELQAWNAALDLPVWERFPEATAANAQEVYPGVGDPLSFDVNLIAVEHGQRTFVEQIGLGRVMGLDERVEPGFFPVFYGHVHINISAQREVVKYIPGTSPDAVDEQLFGQARSADQPPWTPNPRERLIRGRTLLKLIPLVRRTPGDLARNEDAVESFLQEVQSAALDAWDDDRLMATLDRALRHNLRTTEIHLRVTAFSGSVVENLRRFLVRQRFDDIDALVADLCTGLRDIESAKPGRELSRLAATVRADPALRDIFRSGPSAILAALHDSDERSAVIFRERFNRFQRTYGYRGVRELGLTTHVWAQRPESVIALIKSYAGRDDAPDADAELLAQGQRREARTREVEDRLNAWNRRRFRGLLRAAHEGIAGRERAKAQWARSTHIIRLLVREAGRRLVVRGLIDDVDDTPYMRLADLRAAMAGNPRSDLRGQVTFWKETKAVCERVALPERFTGKPIARWREDLAQTEAAASGDVLTGIPVSPGRVTARARVIKELQDDIDLEPGEVLVCPFTDAAWTPLFFNAAAVVMDLGGPLSHGSTVAREYGLPAVVNVKTGTRMIRDGQEITVDGTRGEVVMHG
jgi:phosphohistidine swiveling domain-containing protein